MSEYFDADGEPTVMGLARDLYSRDPLTAPEGATILHEFAAALAAHDREVKEEALREYATLVEEIANLGANSTGLRTPHHLAEYTRTYADRIESEARP